MFVSHPFCVADSLGMPKDRELLPTDPNQDRTISLHFTTNEHGEMRIGVGSDGFDDREDLILMYLVATLESMIEEKNSDSDDSDDDMD